MTCSYLEKIEANPAGSVVLVAVDNLAMNSFGVVSVGSVAIPPAIAQS